MCPRPSKPEWRRRARADCSRLRGHDGVRPRTLLGIVDPSDETLSKAAIVLAKVTLELEDLRLGMTQAHETHGLDSLGGAEHHRERTPGIVRMLQCLHQPVDTRVGVRLHDLDPHLLVDHLSSKTAV